jgi:aminoglycoside 3-N-acetyltransferase
MVLSGMPGPEINATDVSNSLARLGIGSGDAVIVHGSLGSMGKVSGGAEAVIQGILELIGPEGTLVMPTLTDITLPYSPESSPSTAGKLTEVLRKMPGAIRSRHPTHSVAAIGAQAQYVTASHENTTPCGLDSPYGKLCDMHGWVLLLGVDQDRNTAWHVAEDVADVPYSRDLMVKVVEADGTVNRLVKINKFPYGHREFIKWDPWLYEMGLMKVGQVGQAVARLMRADHLLDFALRRLQEDQAAFLCEKPRCIYCLWARSTIDQADSRHDWAALSDRWGCGDPNCEVCNI